MGNKVYILNYLRKGLISSVEKGSSVAKDTKRAQIDVNLKFQLKNVDSGGVENKVLPAQKIELLGPADVKSLNPQAINRVSPAESGDVRLNASYRPYMEFFEEDLPWRYTPFAPGDSSFYPWMRLIAVKTDECVVAFRDGVKIVRINLTEERIGEVFSTTDELARSAHAQIDVEDNFNGTLDEATVNKMLDENPDCGISRVLCTSKLEADTQYVLLLIPTYELGRLSALGMSTDGVNMTAIVTPKPNTDLELPIYYKWKCTTASRSGSFKDLADLLNFTTAADYKNMDANLTVDISQSGLRTVSFDKEKKIDVPVALVMKADPYSNLEDEGKVYRSELQRHLSLNPVFEENELGEVNQEMDPWVVPPVYGARHLLTKRADFEKGPDAGVVNEVNLKLHNRIAAGMGGSVVMKNQEEFVHRAWKRVEVINTLNQMLREYYQMNQVNDCAKDKNIRSSIDKSVLNKMNQGLISDAAIRMLQTSGIYYNNVAPDTMLDYYDQMGVKDSGDTTIGISKQYLVQFYHHDTWKEFVDDDYKYDMYYKELATLNEDFRTNSENAWKQDGMNELDFLKGMFNTAMIVEDNDEEEKEKKEKEKEKEKEEKEKKEKAGFILNPSYSNRLMVWPDSILWNGEESQLRRQYLSRPNYNEDKTEYYPDGSIKPSCLMIKLRDLYDLKDSVYDLLSRYETFSDAHLAEFGIGDKENKIKPYLIRAVVNDVDNCYAWIVPDKSIENIKINKQEIGNSIIFVEFYDLMNNTPCFFFIVPKSVLYYLNPQYSLQYQEMMVRLAANSYGGFDLSDNSEVAQAFDLKRPRNSKIYKNLESYSKKLQDAVDASFTVKNLKPGKIHKQKIKIKMQSSSGYSEMTLIIEFSKDSDMKDIKIRFDSDEYSWLFWQGDYDDFFVPKKDDKGDTKERTFYLERFKDRITIAMTNLALLDLLWMQPESVSISLMSTRTPCFFISLNKYYEVIKNEKKAEIFNTAYKESDYSSQLIQILNIVDEQRGRIESEFKIKPQPSSPTNSAKPANIEVVDPGQLARDRIKELAEEYGVTEFNQMDDRLRDKYPVMIHPDFLDPTYFYLRELSIDYILPSSGNLAKNSISCFYSNQAFEEAFLLGMNTEMGRELMWREYPTDQRGSYFRKFWDQSELPKKEELKSKYYDIEDIDKWKGKLGSNHRSGKSPMLVFAIRGDLMQTYPDTEVFLQQTSQKIVPGRNYAPIKKKDMSAWLTSDTYLVGFSGIKKEDLNNYYLVFEQKSLSLQFSKQAENKNNPYGIVNPQCYLMPAEQ